MKTFRFLQIVAAAWLLMTSFTTMYGQDTIPDPMDDGGPKRVSGGYGYGMAGFGTKDVGQLNQFMNHEVKLQNATLTLGGGGMLMIRNIMLGGEGSSYWRQSGSFGNQDVKYESGWGQFYLGYVLLSKKGILLYPKVAIGGYKESLSLVNKDIFPDMDSLYTGIYAGTSVIKKGALMSFGAGFEWMPGFDQSSGSGIVIGLDFGYHLAITEKAWESQSVSLIGGPNVKPTGLFANLHIGFGGWNRQ